MADVEWEGLREEDEEEEESDDVTRNAFSGRDSLVFLIDCSEGMFVKTEDGGEIPFHLSIKCAANVMKNKIISSEKDLIAIVFYGTKTSDQDVENTFAFQALEQPGAEAIIALNSLLKDGPEEFRKKYGHSDSYSLSDAFWRCSSMFSKCTMKLATRTILLFTNEDHPHKSNPHLQRQALQKASDASANGIELVLMPINKPGVKFDVGKIYKDILLLASEDDFPDATDKFEELLVRVRRKDHKKRTTGKLFFTLPGGIQFSVGVYKLVHKLLKPSPVQLAKDTNEEIQKMNKAYLEETGEILLHSDINYYQEYGGEKIFFDKDEIGQVKRFFEPGITLLGFKPTSSMKLHYHVKPSSFLYPDEHQITGSTRLFSALLRKCVERNVVAICRLVSRTNCAPELITLWPQEEVKDGAVQLTPPGFHIVPLPFAEDIRTLKVESLAKKDPESPMVSANEEQIEKAKQIVKKLQFNFRSENIENPVLQTHWRNIEALALDLDEPDEMIDYTLPNKNAMEKRAGKLVTEFKELVFPKGQFGFVQSQPLTKRPYPPSQEKKKAKVEVEDIDIKAEVKAGQLSKYTVDVLRRMCGKLDIKTTNKKKAELIDEIEKQFM